MKKLVMAIDNLLAKIPQDVLLLVARIAIASVFWRSAQTKISGWEFLGQKWQFFNLNSSTFSLFEYEYDLPLLPPDIAAYLGTFAEFFLPLAIILGLFTRLSALGLFVMTATIQLLVYPDAWPTHILWLVPLVVLLKYGAGTLSIDSMLFKKNRNEL